MLLAIADLVPACDHCGSAFSPWIEQHVVVDAKVGFGNVFPWPKYSRPTPAVNIPKRTDPAVARNIQERANVGQVNGSEAADSARAMPKSGQQRPNSVGD